MACAGRRNRCSCRSAASRYRPGRGPHPDAHHRHGVRGRRLPRRNTHQGLYGAQQHDWGDRPTPDLTAASPGPDCHRASSVTAHRGATGVCTGLVQKSLAGDPRQARAAGAAVCLPGRLSIVRGCPERCVHRLFDAVRRSEGRWSHPRCLAEMLWAPARAACC